MYKSVFVGHLLLGISLVLRAHDVDTLQLTSKQRLNVIEIFKESATKYFGFLQNSRLNKFENKTCIFHIFGNKNDTTRFVFSLQRLGNLKLIDDQHVQL